MDAHGCGFPDEACSTCERVAGEALDVIADRLADTPDVVFADAEAVHRALETEDAPCCGTPHPCGPVETRSFSDAYYDAYIETNPFADGGVERPPESGAG